MPLVLVVEDDPATADALADLLRQASFRVVVARDGGEGVRQARALEPDAIVLDLVLPRIDGWTALREIRALQTSHKPRIVVLSANVDAESRARAFQNGADEYIIKPVGLEAVVTALEHRVVRRNA